jgi:ATP-dependent DNA helicase RecG
VEKAVEMILEIIRQDPKVTQAGLAAGTGLTRRGVEWNLKNLKASGRIRRVGPDKGGHWEVLS